MDGYTKLHAVILDSSIWLEPTHTRIVWITMLAMADADGHVEASLRGLAARARVTDEECRQAIASLIGPDPDSRDGTTGERIRQVEPGVWFVINHEKYRDRQTRRQALGAARSRRYRASVTRNDVTLGDDTSRASVYVSGSGVASGVGESAREEGKPKKAEKPDDGQAAFNEFWEVYNLKVKRPAAWKAWKSARIDDGMVPLILSKAREYASLKAGSGYHMHPSTWLNNRGWEDDMAAHANAKTSRKSDNGHLAVPKVTPKGYYDDGPCDENGWPLDVVNRLDRTDRKE